jgi:hypothetical protein
MKHRKHLTIPCLLVAVYCIGISGVARSELRFSNKCDNQVSAADRRLIEDAFDVVAEYKYAVERHIGASIENRNPYSYMFIDSNKFNRWRESVDEVERGDIKIACEYNATSQYCRNNTDRLGRNYPNLLNDHRVNLCLTNIRNMARGNNSDVDSYPAEVALTAGSLAHELMHFHDGLESHKGETDPKNPKTIAETIGVAMEHLVLTPDLEATITSVDDSLDGNDSFSGSEYALSIDVKVVNRNPYADSSLEAISDATINDPNANAYELNLVIDGNVVTTESIRSLNGLDYEIENFQVTVPAYVPGGSSERIISTTADPDNRYVESDEKNNIDTVSFDTAVDLSVAVEVAAPPRCQSLEGRDGLLGQYSWFEIPYRVTVTNLDQDNSAPGADLVMEYENKVTSWVTPIERVIWLTAFEPAGTQEGLFAVEVPADDNCSAPLRDTRVTFTIDGNSHSIHDTNRADNTEVIIVNADYWRPDYTVRNIQQVGIGHQQPGAGYQGATPSRTISYAVRNVGPARRPGRVGLQSNTHVLDSEGTSVFSEPTPNLDPGDEQVYQASLAVDDCVVITNTISADHQNTVDELEESNNQSAVRLHPITSVGVCPEVDDKQDYEAELGWIEQNGFEVMDKKFEGLNRVEWGTERGNNPIAENVGPGAPILDRLEENPRQ